MHWIRNQMQLQFHADFKASSAFPIKLKSAGGVLHLSAPRGSPFPQLQQSSRSPWKSSRRARRVKLNTTRWFAMLITNDNKTTSPFQTKGFLLSHKNNSQSLFPQQKAIGKICSLCRFLFLVPTSWVRCFCQTKRFDGYKKANLPFSSRSIGRSARPRSLLCFCCGRSPSHTNAPSAINPLMSPHDWPLLMWAARSSKLLTQKSSSALSLRVHA
jgi:hypothetical protein